jgi:hypothetical protein
MFILLKILGTFTGDCIGTVITGAGGEIIFTC